ncbi:aldehyde dehydrogenase family protein [Smaragdicoccus niigatensis]|uniref:aldehyde dehydrogenase family protein n=1 Tax=Smaragdicoccus niigatensis TaxID=359359 RepID=UPI00037DEE39|nr:aldehyde dehydrogenase family protein [Smaragdicoccus niigatensis]
MTATLETFESTNPATGDVVGSFPVQSAQEVNTTVEIARGAADWWGGLSYKERGKHLKRWAARITQNADELAELIHKENGKPLEDAHLELALALEHIGWGANNAEKKLKSESVFPGPLMANFEARIEYRPLGVVGVIGPWNYPVYTPMGSVGYALAAGNTVVFKPSEYTTAVGVYLADAFHAANPDAPRGVLEVVTGKGATGAALCHANVDKIAFTGSTATGKKIMAACAEKPIPVVLELGGKDALIVADDADVKAAADAAVFGGFANAGQTCVGVERVYVVESVRDEFLAAVKEELSHVKAGVSYGPMTMPSQKEVVRRHVEDALKSGGQAFAGGLDSIGDRVIEPVIILDADESCSAVQEETFGPTLTIKTVKDNDEAIRLANGTEFGLGSTVFSKKNGMKIARQLKAGQTSINAPLGFAAIPALPFGGSGQSGFGRIHGEAGLKEFARPHSIARQRFAIPGFALLTFRRTKFAFDLSKKIVHSMHQG